MKDRYKKIRPLGSGSFATSWLAQNQNGANVVLKEYKSQSISEARREYLFLNAAADQNIVRVIDFEETPPILIMEFIEGKELDYSAGTGEKYKIFAKLAATLAHLHSIGICFNDLKPANIIIQNNEPYLIDLGLATPDHFSDSIFRGTPAYSAPEKLTKNHNSFAADVFAFGLICLHILQHHLPAERMSFPEYKKLLSSPEEWQKYLKANVRDNFLRKILSSAAIERPAMAEIAAWFAKKAEINLSIIKRSLINDHLFSYQLKATQKLIQTKKLICSEEDEPERIINHVRLWLETDGMETVVLKESDFIWQPEKFFSGFGMEKPKSLFDTIMHSSRNYLLHRDLTDTKSELFNQLSNFKNCFLIDQKNESDLDKVTGEELEEICRRYSLKIIFKEFSATPRTIRRLLIEADGSWKPPKTTSEIIGLLAAFKLPIAISLLEKIFPKFYSILPELVMNSKIKLQEDNLIYMGEQIKVKLSENLIQKVLNLSQESQNLTLAAKAALLSQDHLKAVEFLETHINFLSNKEYYLTALEIMHIFSKELSLPVSLQKKEAFLYWKNGLPETALQKYDQIPISDIDPEFAVILSDKAVVLQELNRLDEAQEIYEKIMIIFRETSDKKSYLRSLNNLAVIHVQQKNFAAAEKAFLQLLQEASQAENKQFMTMAHLNLADVYLRKGNWKQSLYQAQTAAEYGRKFKRSTIEIWARIYAIQAQWAMGTAEKLDEIITQMLDDKNLLEQTSLMEDFCQNMLPVLLDLSPDNCDKCIKILTESSRSSESRTMIMFWYHIRMMNFIEAQKKAFSLKDVVMKNIAEAYLSADKKKMLIALQQAGIQNDCFEYLQNAFFILKHELFQKDQDIELEVKNYLSQYSFAPISKMKADSEPELKHLDLLWQIISLIHSNESFANTISAILNGIIRIAQLERAVFYQFKSNEVAPMQAIDYNLRNIDVSNIRVSSTVLQETIRQGHIRFYENLQEDTVFDIHSSIFGLGLRTAVCYPLIINGLIRGAIYADATAAKTFSAQEQSLLEALFAQAKAALEKNEKIENLLQIKERVESTSDDSFPEIIGSSKPMQKIFSLLRTVGSHNVNILITGPTGSGKELIAKALHKLYNPKSPFIAVNCAAIPENLLESELFGYSKGAFTGAVKDTKGKIEAAEGGTLFLDEIGDMPAALQAKLLRVLQDRLITPLGSTKEIPVSFRMITATNQALKELVDSGKFREDLYYRLNVVQIDLPALSERKDDILPLAKFFLNKYNVKFEKKLKNLGEKTARFLLQKDWRGNVRELENTIEKAVLLSDGEELNAELLDLEKGEFDIISADQMPVGWEEYREYRKRIIEQMDKRYAENLVKKASGNINKASHLGRIPRPQIYRIIKKKQ